MTLRTSLIVIAVTAAIFALGLVGVVVLGKAAQAMRSVVTSESARQQFVAKWKPPKTLSTQALLPERIGVMTVTNRESFERMPELGVNLPGVRGVYAMPQGPEVEILAFQTRPETEAADREAAVDALKRKQDSRSGTKTFFRINDRCVYSASQPAESGELWMLSGWLILFRSDREIPLPFVRTYLEAIAEPGR